MLLLAKSYVLGLIFILAVAIIWAGSSVLIQYIYQDLDFKSPFTLTYISTSEFILFLPLWQLWIALGFVKKGEGTGRTGSDDEHSGRHPNSVDRDELSSPLHTQDDSNLDTSNVADRQASNESAASSNSFMTLSLADTEQGDGYGKNIGAVTNEDKYVPHRISDDRIKSRTSSDCTLCHYEILKMAAIICPFWFLSNLLYNYSLFMTSISSSTIISNLSGSFTLTFSYLGGLEDLTYGKVLGVIVCFGGAVCVALQDSGESSQDHTVAGDVIALLSAIGYGLYTSIIRYLVPDDEGVSMQLLLGYIGLLNAVVLAPAMLALYFFRLDNLTSMTGIVFGFITLNGLCNNVLSDYLWARAVVLTSPTVATIGMSITIPLALMSDYFMWGMTPTGLSSSGAFLVIVGFALVNISSEHEKVIRQWFRGGYEQVSLKPPCEEYMTGSRSVNVDDASED